MPAPSPSTNPPRRRSKGRDADGGSSLAVDVAPMLQKPATPSGLIIESAPPASIQRRRPSAIMRKAEPIASVPAAHAETCVHGGSVRSSRCASRATERSDGVCR
jgi:hypothetical protein